MLLMNSGDEQKMKIAFLTDVYKPVMNGVVISVESFANGLRKLNQQVYIFAPRYPEYKDKDRNVKRFRMVQKIPADYYLQVPLSISIGRLISECDIIHVHHPFISGIIGLYRSKLHRIPLVFTHHTIYEEYAHYMPFIGGSREFKDRLNEYVVFFCNNCDCVIAPTEDIRKMLKVHGVKTRIEVIPTGVNVQEFRKTDGSKIRKRFGEEAIIVLYLGRIAKEKNIEVLIDIFKGIAKERKNIRFVLVGDGPLKEKLEKKAKNYKNIIFTGKVEETEQYYKAADIFASASKTETQGIVFVEAKAAGLPAIAWDAPGPRSLIKDGKDGFLVGSKEELKEKLIELIENEKLRKKMSETSFKNCKNYSIEATSKKLLELYKDLIRKKS